MNQQRKQRLKPLLNDLPPGYVADAAWLTARGIDRKSILQYEQRGWLEKLARGVYRRPPIHAEKGAAARDDNWRLLVLSMQKIMRYPVHVGGRTALSLQGFDHYLALGDAPRRVYLYGDPPSWLARLPNADLFEMRSLALFSGAMTGVAGADDDQHHDDDDYGTNGAVNTRTLPGGLVASTPERAILEMLNELPAHESFHNVDAIFESLANLRPRFLADLLKECRSVKVKRLFFVYADQHNHAWRKYLNPDDFDLGSGPRALVEGGRLHPRYAITVPADLIDDVRSEGPDDGP